MDSGPSQALGTARDVTPPGTRRGRRRRRPTGEPPPLPRHLESTGVGWMVAAVGLIILALLAFTVGRYGRGVAFVVADDWVVQRLAAARTPGMASLMRGVTGLLGSVWTVKLLAWGTLIVLVVYKRYRQLIVGLVSVELTAWLAIALSAAVRRPRPSVYRSRRPGPAGRCRRDRSPSWPRSAWPCSTAWSPRAAGARPASGS
jgi:hypothetical protein